MTKKCDNNCCNNFFDSYNEVEDDYEIQRLEDIIEICEFLIKVKKHRKEKKQTFNKIIEESEKNDENHTWTTTNTEIPFNVYRYKLPKKYKNSWIPYWDQVWF